ncbi:hypothetical protein BH24ACT3_BH24ACT3_11960 [soil metagenome]
MNPLLRGALCGAAAGAAGTTALNAITYLDMVVQARPTSSTPEDTVEKLADVAHVPVPGDEEARRNRIAGLGPLSGLVAGVGMGALLGLVRGSGWRPASSVVGVLTACLGGLLAGNGPMTVLGVTDPRTWTAADWASDIVPHLGYGIVTATVLEELDASRPGQSVGGRGGAGGNPLMSGSGQVTAL